MRDAGDLSENRPGLFPGRGEHVEVRAEQPQLNGRRERRTLFQLQRQAE